MHQCRWKAGMDRKAWALAALVMIIACHGAGKEGHVLDREEQEQAIAGLRDAYAAFNRGDIDRTVAPLDPKVEWTEPTEFPGGGTYHGIQGVKQYLTQSRARAAKVISEPEQFLCSGDRIVVFVHARVLLHGANQWQEINLADVYTFRGGKAIAMSAFADRNDALRWVGLDNLKP